MTYYYVDTSALNKRYLAEKGSAWVRSWIRPSAGNVIIVCELTALESFTTFARLRRENKVSAGRLARLQNLALLHMAHHYAVIPFSQSVLIQARSLVNRHPLRTLDAIHLASAQEAQTILNTPITFVAADKVLLAAASAEGFTVDDPNTHP